MYILFLILWIILNGRVTVETGFVRSGDRRCGLLVYLQVHGLQPPQGSGRFSKAIAGVSVRFCASVGDYAANIKVMQLILTEKEEVVPELIYFRTDLKSDASRVALANSITLTPGTITVTLEQDEFCVHCLDEEMAEGIEDSSFVHLLHKMEQTPERGEK